MLAILLILGIYAYCMATVPLHVPPKGLNVPLLPAPYIDAEFTVIQNKPAMVVEESFFTVNHQGEVVH